MKTIGVLALQGGFEPHMQAARRLGHAAREVREPAALAGIDLLVLPGGESTTQLSLMEECGLDHALLALPDLPLFATCAGVILLAKQVDPAQRSLGLLHVSVQRNAYGAQRESFAADLGNARGLFIRAPRIVHTAPTIEVFARHQGDPVWVRQGAIHALTFHPELVGDDRPLAMALGDAVS